MSQTIITTAFEQWKARQSLSNEPVELDEFVFALVPGLDPDKPINRAETVPPVAQIVHRQAVSRTGTVNENAVVYSVVLGADTGDFSFNWIGLINKASGTLAVVVHAPAQQKIKTAAGQQGNVLTRSFLLEFNGAKAETGINTPSETWQIDFTARMARMDERQRLENTDIYGNAAFFDDGWLVDRAGEQYFVTAGAGYVGGLRAQLDENQALAAPVLPCRVWLDVCWKGTLISTWDAVHTITVADALADYVLDGVQHYVFAVAAIDADGVITDLRPKGTTDSQYAEDRFMKKSECGADIPDKPLFVKNLGLEEVAKQDGNVYPVGSPIPWPSDVLPVEGGYAFMVGQPFDRVVYTRLAVVYPAGVLPDMRQETIKGAGAGRAPLSKELDGNKAHSHGATVSTVDLGTKTVSTFDYGTKTTDQQGAHTHTFPTGTGQDYTGIANQARTRTSSPATDAAGTHAHNVYIGAHNHTVVLGEHTHAIQIMESGNSETTVKNTAFNYIVRLA